MDFYKREFHFLLAPITKLENLSHWGKEVSQEMKKKKNIWDEKEIKKKLSHWHTLPGIRWSQLGATGWVSVPQIVSRIRKKCWNSFMDLISILYLSPLLLQDFPLDWQLHVFLPLTQLAVAPPYWLDGALGWSTTFWCSLSYLLDPSLYLWWCNVAYRQKWDIWV